MTTGVAQEPIDRVRKHAVDAATLDDHALLERIAADEAEIARLQARQLADLAEFARRPSRIERFDDDPAAVAAGWAAPGVFARETADDEVGMRLRLSRRAAEGRLRLGCSLVRLPQTRDALAAGRIDLGRARVIADEVADLDPATAREVEARVIDAATRLTAARLRPRVRRAVLAADPVAADSRHLTAANDRRVVLEPAEDGMAWLHAYLTAVEARAVHTTLTAAARAAKTGAARENADRPRDQRAPLPSLDQLRADALVAMSTEAIRTGELHGFGPLARHLGEAATLHVTVPAATLLGFDDAPAVLEGYGPITAGQARDLAPDARWRRILTDPASGTVLDVGTTAYKPPPGLARHVEARDQSCAAPGCGQPAARCELDHVIPFPDGPTSAANLRAECTHHHQRLKHHPAVTLEADADGGSRWTMPTGHTYETRPPPLAPVWTDTPPAEPAQPEPWWTDWCDEPTTPPV